MVNRRGDNLLTLISAPKLHSLRNFRKFLTFHSHFTVTSLLPLFPLVNLPNSTDKLKLVAAMSLNL